MTGYFPIYFAVGYFSRYFPESGPVGASVWRDPRASTFRTSATRLVAAAPARPRRVRVAPVVLEIAASAPSLSAREDRPNIYENDERPVTWN